MNGNLLTYLILSTFSRVPTMSYSKISYSSRVKRTDIKYEHIIRSRRGMSMANDANPDRQQDNRLKLELAEIERQKRQILRKQRLGSGAARERIQSTPSALKRDDFVQTRLSNTLKKYGMDLPMMNKSPRPDRAKSCDAYKSDIVVPCAREALKKCLSTPGRSKRIYSSLYDSESYDRFCEKVVPLQEQYRAMRADLDDKITGRRFIKTPVVEEEGSNSGSDSEYSLPSTPETSDQELNVPIRSSPFMPSLPPKRLSLKKSAGPRKVSISIDMKLKPPAFSKPPVLQRPKTKSAPPTSSRRQLRPTTTTRVGSSLPTSSTIPEMTVPSSEVSPATSYLHYCDDINYYLSESSRLYNNRVVTEDQVELHNWEAYRSCCPISSAHFVKGPDMLQLSYLSFH